MPLCQYFAYLEVAEEEHQAGFVPHGSNLWRTYESLQGEDVRFAMREVRQRGDIYPVFRELFQRQPEAKRSAEW